MKLEPVLEVVFSPSFCIEKQELERERERDSSEKSKKCTMKDIQCC